MGEASLPEPEWYWDQSSKKQRVELGPVNGAPAKLSSGTDKAPDSTSREIHLVVRAGQRVLLVRGAEVVDVCEQPFFDANLDKASQDRRYRLDYEAGTGRSFDVMP